jgi:hypothetical protein
MTPPAAPLPPAKKSNVLLWILIGVGGFVALIVVVVLAGGFFVAHKIKQSNFEFKTADGAFQIGGAGKVPTWVPDYPGSSPRNAFSAQGKDGRSGTFTFKTIDSADHVAKYYREQLEASGLQVAAVVSSETSQVIRSEDPDRHHTVMVMANPQGNETTVNVTYTSK